ncbi:preprotein translocase subunit TatA [Halobacteria archaeon HArc-gm2]|nr:preprotein translocase subunit TatA [Halobacteria archaeon HArc-gm2]
MPSTIAQIGIPGFQELIIVLLISLLIFGIPIALIVVFIRRKRAADAATEERVAELEREVEELRAADSESDRASGGDR